MCNVKVDKAFFTSDGRNLIIDQRYFELLKPGTYTFKAVGGTSAYEFTVEVTEVTKTTLKDMVLQKGCNAVIYLGNVQVNTVTVNGVTLNVNEYKVRNYTLTISASLLTQDTNTIVINGDTTVTVNLT